MPAQRHASAAQRHASAAPASTRRRMPAQRPRGRSDAAALSLLELHVASTAADQGADLSALPPLQPRPRTSERDARSSPLAVLADLTADACSRPRTGIAAEPPPSRQATAAAGTGRGVRGRVLRFELERTWGDKCARSIRKCVGLLPNVIVVVLVPVISRGSCGVSFATPKVLHGALFAASARCGSAACTRAIPIRGLRCSAH